MNPSDAALLESWALSLHQKRPKTIELYLRLLTGFAGWLSSRGVDLTSASKQDVLAWIGSLQAQGLKGNTIRSRFFSVRAFYRWAHDEGEVVVNPAAGITVDRPHPPAPDTLSSTQIKALLKACEGTAFRERRDMAMIRLLVATGVRVSECTGLALTDLDLPNRVAVVRDGKGGKSRAVRFDPATGAALDRYKRVRARHRHATLPNLWLGERGATTPKGVALILDKRGVASGVGHVFPHQMRHTWADRWLEGGGSEGDLQKLGGWDSPEIMRRYGESRAADRALGAYDQIDPMRGL